MLERAGSVGEKVKILVEAAMGTWEGEAKGNRQDNLLIKGL